MQRRFDQTVEDVIADRCGDAREAVAELLAIILQPHPRESGATRGHRQDSRTAAPPSLAAGRLRPTLSAPDQMK
jgi:hypothetical protein